MEVFKIVIFSPFYSLMSVSFNHRFLPIYWSLVQKKLATTNFCQRKLEEDLSQLFLYLYCFLIPRNIKVHPKLKPRFHHTYLKYIFINASSIYIYICTYIYIYKFMCPFILYIYIYLNTSRCLYILIGIYGKYFTEIPEVNLPVRLCLQLSVLFCHHVGITEVQECSSCRESRRGWEGEKCCCASQVPGAGWECCLLTSKLSGKKLEIRNTSPYLQVFSNLKIYGCS